MAGSPAAAQRNNSRQLGFFAQGITALTEAY